MDRSPPRSRDHRYERNVEAHRNLLDGLEKRVEALEAMMTQLVAGFNSHEARLRHYDLRLKQLEGLDQSVMPEASASGHASVVDQVFAAHERSG